MTMPNHQVIKKLSHWKGEIRTQRAIPPALRHFSFPTA